MENYERTITIKLKNLFKLCTKEPDLLEKIQIELTEKNDKIQLSVFDKILINQNLVEYITCINNGKHIIGKFVINYSTIYKDIIKKLGLKDELKKGKKLFDDENLTNKINDKIEQLKNITTIEDLKNKFPYIYDDFEYGINYMEDLNNAKSDFKKEEKEEYNNFLKYKDYWGIGYRIEKFIERQVNIYKKILSNLEEYKEQCNQNSLNDYIEYYFDKEKVAMYVVNQYINCAKSEKNEKRKEMFISLIEKYILSSYKKDVELNSPKKTINYRLILEEFLYLKYGADITKGFDGLTNEEIAELYVANAKKRICKVNWEIIPSGTIEDSNIIKVPGTHKKTKMTPAELDHLRTKGTNKSLYYKTRPPMLSVKGKIGNTGYIARVYPNGNVILDTGYNASCPSSAIGNAIYIIPAESFLRLSHFSKPELNNLNIPKIVHSEGWEERVDKVITKVGTEKEVEEAKILTKVLLTPQKKEN